jgi:DNA-binding transcriptional ArsR family regulator
MAAVAEVCRTISEATGVPRRTVDHLARRLGEAGLLPRGPRGRNAPQFDSIHMARLLVGVMAVANGIDYTAASVVQAVRRIEGLRQEGEIESGLYADCNLDDPETELQFVPAGSFIGTVAHRMRWIQIGASKGGVPTIEMTYGNGGVSAVGLTFGNGDVYGWIEFDQGGTGMDCLSNPQRITFGHMSAVLAAGMKQNVRVEVGVLSRLGELLGPLALLHQSEISLPEGR